MTRYNPAFRNIKQYIVRYHHRSMVSRTLMCTINAPSISYIRENWSAICGSTDFVIDSVKKAA